jgi:cardiolipin synthase
MAVHRWLRQLPNVISSLRILLVAPIAAALVQHRFVATLYLFVVAAASDAADGYLARTFGWQTDLGGILDPIADKLMLATVFVSLAFLGLVPVWLMAVVVARDAVIALGAIAYRVLLGPVKASPSIISKLNTLCQMAFILAVIGREEAATPPVWSIISLGALVFVTTVVSGIDYVLVYGRRALAQAPREVLGSNGPKPT